MMRSPRRGQGEYNNHATVKEEVIIINMLNMSSSVPEARGRPRMKVAKFGGSCEPAPLISLARWKPSRALPAGDVHETLHQMRSMYLTRLDTDGRGFLSLTRNIHNAVR